MSSKILFLLISYISLLNPLYARVIFKNSTEDSVKSWATASISTTSAVVASLTDRELLNAELEEKGYHIGHTKFLVEKKIALGHSSKNYRFVRPATDPFISYFYGAHNFQYWFMERSKVIFSARSDEVAVLSSGHHGMKDIVVSHFRAAGRYWREIRYTYGINGYEAVSCMNYESSKPEKKFPCPN